jgi:hypothetical protein
MAVSNTTKIHIEDGYSKNAYTYYPVVIVGAGESGIAMGCQLKQQLGFDQFRIFERQSGAGGTWWINRYPGVACDVYVSRPVRVFSSTDVAQSKYLLLLLVHALLHRLVTLPHGT